MPDDGGDGLGGRGDELMSSALSMLAITSSGSFTANWGRSVGLEPAPDKPCDRLCSRDIWSCV
jgi:hypothetical protein